MRSMMLQGFEPGGNARTEDVTSDYVYPKTGQPNMTFKELGPKHSKKQESLESECGGLMHHSGARGQVKVKEMCSEKENTFSSPGDGC